MRRRFAIVLTLMTTVLAACEQPARVPRRAVALCGSSHTARTLKDILFDRAAARPGEGDQTLERLRASAGATVEAAQLAGYDEDSETVHCTGVLHISLPPGALPAADGGRDITAEVSFAAEPDPAGDGMRYTLSGGDEVILALAARHAGPALAEAAPAPPAPPASAAAPAPPSDPEADQDSVAEAAAAAGDTGRSNRPAQAGEH